MANGNGSKSNAVTKALAEASKSAQDESDNLLEKLEHAVGAELAKPVIVPVTTHSEGMMILFAQERERLRLEGERLIGEIATLQDELEDVMLAHSMLTAGEVARDRGQK